MAGVVALAVLPLPGAEAYGPPLVTAVNQIAPQGSDGSLAYARIRAAGASFVHTRLNWARAAPANRPPGFDAANPGSPGYDWTEADRQVELAVGNGLQPILDIFSAPRWAEGGPGTSAGGINSPDPAQLGQFAHAAALRYDGTHPGLPRVRYWAIWNEPNASLFLTPQFVGGQPASINRYRDMVNDSASGVHAIHADNVVVAGELFPNTAANSAVQSIGPLAFMRGLFCLSAGRHPHRTCQAEVHADVWSTHPYSSGSPQDRPANANDVWIGNLRDEAVLITAAQRSGALLSSGRVPFWVTEYGWDTKPPNARGAPLALDQRWIAEAVYRMWSAGVSLAAYFDLRDDPTGSSNFQSGLYFSCSGVVGCDRPKPALAAFTFPFVAYTSKNNGVLVWGRTSAGVPGRVLVQASSGRSWRTLARLRTDGNGIFTGHLTLPRRVSRRASLRAVVAGANSPAFSLVRPQDLPVPPFG